MSMLLWLSLALTFVLAGGCSSLLASNPPSPNQTGQTQQTQLPDGQEQKMISQEEAQEIAINFLRSSSTFSFDGIESTMKLAASEAGANANNWVFQFEFQSRQAGYGDRTGLMLAQVITDHKAQIVVERGEVVYAVLDGKWDELTQKRIE